MITPRRIDDQQLGERYLADQLDATEQADFEEYYAENPQQLRDLQAVAGIKLGLALLRASDELDALTVPRRSLWPLGIALAASLLVAILGFSYLHLQDATQAVMSSAAEALTDASGTPLNLLTTLDVQRTRSDVDLVISKPGTAGAIELRIRDAFEPPPARYRLELFVIGDDETRQPKGRVDGLAPNAAGVLNVYLNPAALDVGSYEIQLFKDQRSGEDNHVGDFLVDIVAEGAASVETD